MKSQKRSQEVTKKPKGSKASWDLTEEDVSKKTKKGSCALILSEIAPKRAIEGGYALKNGARA